eukprot:Pompholyxophrys_punicea_v1_NODE_390_length_2072_cov_12.695092.p1 type:complete len:197 gc:universal NODE_390_length_2072_cov_12.695092:367-957(+)
MEAPAAEWVEHKSSDSPQWKQFKRSAVKDPKTNRYKAKCCRCGHETEGRLNYLQNHIQHSCKEISGEEKMKYLQAIVQANATNSTQVKRDHASTSSVVQSSSANLKNFFTPISNETTAELHSLLLKAFVNSNIPFRFADDPFFKLYQEKLARSPYQIPSRYVLSESVLPKVHLELNLQMVEKVILFYFLFFFFKFF